MTKRLALWLVVVLGLVMLGARALDSYARAVAVVVQAAEMEGWPARLTSIRTRPFTSEALTVASRHGDVRARVYRPSSPGRAVVLVPGVHASGIDEPRLVGFARHLASVGLVVLTPELPDLMRYEITARSTDMIEDAGRWLAGAPSLSPDGRVGLMGISFGGGLSIVAAGRPGLRNRVAFAFSLGGHANFPRVLRYLCTGLLPDGTRHPPHDYGVAIVLLGLADTVVSEEQAPALRAAILTFLEASRLDMVDRRAAAETFARARALADELSEPAATFMRLVNARNVNELGPKLLPYVERLTPSPSLSPDQSPAPSGPVYLLHGTDDNVIPAVESALLADHLAGAARVRFLASALITHAEMDRRPAAADVWQLVAFWARLLDE